MKNNISQKGSEQFFSQLLLMSSTDNEWLVKRIKAQTYYREHLSNTSSEIVKEKLRWINTVEGTRIYEASEVAERLIKISSFDSRVQKGDDALVIEVVKTFASQGKEYVTWAQFQNALHFLALHAPGKFAEINAFIKGLWEETARSTNQLKGHLAQIPFDTIYDVYKLVKAIYDAIIEVANLPDATYDTIYDKLHNYGNAAIAVITHPEVLSAVESLLMDGIDDLIKAQAPFIGTSLPTREILRQLGKIIGKYVNPYFQEIHQKHINNN